MASNKRSHDDDNTALSRKSTKKQQDKGSSSSSAAAENTNPNNVKVFTCDICQKTFSQGRALGGHKSSHNKYKCIIINTIEEDMKKNPRSNPKNNRPEVDDDHQQVKDHGHHQEINKDDGREQIIINNKDDEHGDWTMASVESSTSQESYDTEDLDDDSDGDDDDDEDDHRFHECMQCEMIFEAKKLLEEHNKKAHGDEDHHSRGNNSSYIFDLNKPPYEGDEDDS